MTGSDLPIDTSPVSESPPPGIKVHFLPDDGPLVVAIYPDDDHGIVYRWDNGLEEPPAVVLWRSPRTTAGPSAGRRP